MDPVQKRWLFENWLADREDAFELAKYPALLQGMFTNPKAVNQFLNQEQRDKNAVSSSEEDFEESLKMVENPSKNRKRDKKLKK